MYWSLLNACIGALLQTVQIVKLHIQEMYLAAYNANIPIRRVKCRRPNRNPWLSTGILTSVRNKNRMYKLLRCCGIWTLSDEVNYKNYRNKLNMIIMVAEKMYILGIYDVYLVYMMYTWCIRCVYDVSLVYMMCTWCMWCVLGIYDVYLVYMMCTWCIWCILGVYDAYLVYMMYT